MLKKKKNLVHTFERWLYYFGFYLQKKKKKRLVRYVLFSLKINVNNSKHEMGENFWC